MFSFLSGTAAFSFRDCSAARNVPQAKVWMTARAGIEIGGSTEMELTLDNFGMAG